MAVEASSVVRVAAKSKLPVMISIVLAMLVASMDTTIANTTMPVIAKELGNFNLYAWSFASYMIMSTVIAPVAGRISDLFGRKTIFGAGIILFLLGSILCGFANSMVQLVIYRAVQGIGAGVMMPFPSIIAGDLFAVEKRGKIQALFTGMWGLSAILAPMLGAFFVEYANWRWIFFINIPICLVSFILLSAYKEVYEPKKSKVDVLGALIFAVGISLLLLTTIVEQYTFAYGIAGIVVMVGFYLYEKNHESPIVPLTLFQNKPFAWMKVNTFLACVSLFGASSFLPLFLQEEGYSLFISGVALLGMSFGWMAVSVPAGKWIMRYGYSKLIIAGNILLVVSGSFLLMLKQGSGFWFAFFAMVVQGLAFGLIFTVSTIGSQQLVEPHQKGVATSIQLFSSNIGTAIGVTIMGAILAKASSFYAGFEHLFLYGFIVCLFAFASSFMIRKV
ncbi:MFS transporter [Paenibacillus radicis (ex Xue et al. 2023)]|uniref:MFS-type drug efflux transporter P55 n=1 Tax=Paenibacillus radicis (ex Xue et al. 2023) TaxID=2972489 RepID=A0ABT1YEV9_9BACL|nr:MFS transporter [Paenibacillus radicis (ex Xue et al. 2023)]MCR8631734.1 MFS transporter [Paenibacillus radicis (ex Xue et al. 2023)]